MIQAKCIKKFRDYNNKIYGYSLQDINGQTQDVTPDDLKRAILNKQIVVVNLTLTSDGRLIDKTPEKQLENKKIMPNTVEKPVDVNNEIDNTINKPYDAKSYTEFVKLLIPLMEKTFKFTGVDKFDLNCSSYDNDTNDITYYNGTMGDFIYENERCYIDIDYTYDVETKDGVLQYNVMIKDGDDSEQYSFKHEFDSLNMKAHFSQILKGTQHFIHHIMSKWSTDTYNFEHFR